MKRTTRNFRPDVLLRWRQVTDLLGYGPKGMVKLLLVLLSFAEKSPELFRKR